MKEYIEMLKQDETTVEKIFGRYDLSKAKSNRQKVDLLQVILNDKEFRRYLYSSMFKEKG